MSKLKWIHIARKREHRPVVIAFVVIIAVGAVILFAPGSPWTGIRAAARTRLSLILNGTAHAESATRMLNVPFYRQQHSLSCEMASLRSALKAVGVDVTEAQLIKELPRDTTPKKFTSRTSFTWGDPDKGFVGNIDGAMPSSGYGVHALPVAKVAEKYVKATVISVEDPEVLAAAIDAGHPLEVWSVLGSRPSSYKWTTPEGKTIDAALYEHSLVVSGYKRDENGAVSSVFVVDPKTGLREESWKDFHWRTGFLNHQAVEIEPITF
jgi:uncharacterized protein YvpB